MRATVETTALPFADRRSRHSAGFIQDEAATDWLLAFRHAQISFYPQDRLLLLYGHQLVFHLGLHAATERVFAGEPVLYLDGANTFDPFAVGRLARAHRRQPRTVLSMIHLARAFTGHQMERLVCDCLSAALDRYHARTAMLSGLFETFYDQAIPEADALRSFARMMEAVSTLAQQGYRLLCLCPSAPILTRTSRRCLELLRGRADRVIRVHEEHGLVRLEEEGRQPSHTWEVARTALELR